MIDRDAVKGYLAEFYRNLPWVVGVLLLGLGLGILAGSLQLVVSTVVLGLATTLVVVGISSVVGASPEEIQEIARTKQESVEDEAARQVEAERFMRVWPDVLAFTLDLPSGAVLPDWLLVSQDAEKVVVHVNLDGRPTDVLSGEKVAARLSARWLPVREVRVSAMPENRAVAVVEIIKSGGRVPPRGVAS